MTVENTQNKMPPLQMGTTNEYPFTFAVLLQDPTEEEAVEAIKASVLQADGTEIELVYNTDYTVTLNTDRIGGTLTVNDIRTSSDYITIYRQYAQTQEVDYKDFNSAPAETFEQCFDKLTMLSQQQQEEINRSIKLPVSSDITKLSLPNPVAGRTLKWNESETGLINSDVSIDEIDEFVKSANESAEIAVEKAEEIQGKLDEALEVADTIKDIEIIATLKIGQIGIAPLGIDETLNMERYLNGQIILQDQFKGFTEHIKKRVQLYPSIACTEDEWQTEVTMSAFSQCGKFVIDDNAGTIRLPKVVNIQGLTDLSKLGEIVEAGLPNITGTTSAGDSTNTNNSGAFYYIEETNNQVGTSNYKQDKIGFDASLSNPIYGNSNTVQQEQIQYPYFIQVATGAETEDNIINEIELNNPFSLLDYKYSEYELNNISWLRSEGQYNSKAIYPAVYDLLLKIYNGTETKAGVSVKLTTETFTDYDFVLNTAEETFRLPIKVKVLPLGDTAQNYFSTINSGELYGSGLPAVFEAYQATHLAGAPYSTALFDGTSTARLPNGLYNLVTDLSNATISDDLYLYFYVGETVQNANLINAGRIEEKVADLIPNNSSLIAGYCIPDYSSQIILDSGTGEKTYVAPSKGWFGYNFIMEGNNTGYVKVNGIQVISNRPAGANYYESVSGLIPIDSGDVIKYYTNVDGSEHRLFNFYPMKGAN